MVLRGGKIAAQLESDHDIAELVRPRLIPRVTRNNRDRLPKLMERIGVMLSGERVKLDGIDRDIIVGALKLTEVLLEE